MPKVLLIDDSKTIQKVAGLILKGSAYRLLTAEDGETGKQLALREKPDITLVDFTLGPKNGLDLIREFSDEPLLQGMRSALLYSHFKHLNSSDLEKSGAKGKLAKPFDAKEFLDLIHQLSQSFSEPEKKDEILEIAPAANDPLGNLFTEEELDQCLNFLEKPLVAMTTTSKPIPSQKITRQIVSADDSLHQVPVNTVEKICREVIPPLAEKIIREEIQKLIKESR